MATANNERDVSALFDDLVEPPKRNASSRDEGDSVPAANRVRDVSRTDSMRSPYRDGKIDSKSNGSMSAAARTRTRIKSVPTAGSREKTAAPRIKRGSSEMKTGLSARFSTITDFVNSYGVSGVFDLFLEWFVASPLPSLVTTALIILCGTLVSKNIAFVLSAVLLFIGWIAEQRSDESDSGLVYLCSVVSFVIPMLY